MLWDVKVMNIISHNGNGKCIWAHILENFGEETNDFSIAVSAPVLVVYQMVVFLYQATGRK